MSFMDSVMDVCAGTVQNGLSSDGIISLKNQVLLYDYCFYSHEKCVLDAVIRFKYVIV